VIQRRHKQEVMKETKINLKKNRRVIQRRQKQEVMKEKRKENGRKEGRLLL
jgi:hypothetical protein